MTRPLRLYGMSVAALVLLAGPASGDGPVEKRIPLRVRGRTSAQLLQNREQYLGHVHSILEVEDDVSDPVDGADANEIADASAAAEAARATYVDARRLCSSDPRLETAVGIALLRAGENAEAMRRLSSAIKSRSILYPPAAELYLYYSVAEGKHAAIAQAVPDYARRLGQRPDQWPDEDERVRAAEWLGRLMGYLLKGPATVHDDRMFQQLARADQSVNRMLPPSLTEAYESGRRAVATEYSRHKSGGADGEEAAAGPVGKDVGDSVARAQEALEQEKSDLVTQTRDRIRTLQQKLQTLAAEMVQLNRRTDQVEDRAGNLNLFIQSGRGTPAMEQELSALQIELQRLVVVKTQKVNLGRQLSAELKGTIAAYQKATGKAIDLETELADANRRLKAMGAVAEEAMLLKTYLSCDLDTCAAALLESYKQ
ncbi:hypothetical protein [Maioricimonas rarisocia]|nr:hypothetical protein [Maioricimonas rarisocia]